MAKDPAFLFYTGDFSTGTQFFTDEQVGIFIRLLMAQHQHGRLSEKQVKMICKSHDKEVMEKFLKDENNLYYNERLEAEISKRKSFSESRKNNRLGKNKEVNNTSYSCDSSLDEHMENENENENIIEVIQLKEPKTKSKRFTPPKLEEVVSFFMERGYPIQLANRAFEYYDTANWSDSKGNKVKNWKQKMLSVWLKEENRINDKGASRLDQIKRAGDLAENYLMNKYAQEENDLNV